MLIKASKIISQFMNKFLFAFIIMIYLIPGCIAVMVHTGTIKSNCSATDQIMQLDDGLTADLICHKVSVNDSSSYVMLKHIPAD